MRWQAAVPVFCAAGLFGCGASGGGRLLAGGYIAPVALASATPGPPASAWPGAEYDARHSAGAAAVGPQLAHVRWTRRLEGPVAPGPAVGVDGSIYIASNAGALHALDPRTGRDHWRFAPSGAFGSSDLSTTPGVLADGTVLWPGPGNTLYALNAAGREQWHARFASFVLSPTVVGQTVYVAEMDGDLHALNVATGRVRWSIPLGQGDSYGAPAVAGDGTVYGTIDHDLVSVRDLGRRAAILWRFRVGEIIEVSPAVAPDGTVVLGTNDDYEYGISSRGREIWRYRRDSQTYSSAAVTADGHAIFGDHHGYLTVLDARTGRLIRRTRADGLVWTSPAVDARGDVYFGTHSGHIYGLSPSGAQLFDLPTGGSVESYPALDAHGTLFVGSEDGRLYAVGSDQNALPSQALRSP